MGNRIYGCDDCLAVCPWNRFARAAPHAQAARPRRPARAALAELAALDDAGFRALFAGSPVKRIGRNRFVRNVLIAIGNSGRPALAGRRPLADDPDPVVAEAAGWAVARLSGTRAREVARSGAGWSSAAFPLAGHRTSVALEPEFWSALRHIAATRGQSLSALVAQTDSGRMGGQPLASALQLVALRAFCPIVDHR